jgi:5'(3')-deoxyribonucleotidase
MPDFSDMKNATMKFDPIILTAVPYFPQSRIKAIKGKRLWINQHMSSHVPIFTVNVDRVNYLKINKVIFCKNKNDILIDDNELNVETWKNAGGKAIVYVDAQKTIEELDIIIKECNAEN